MRKILGALGLLALATGIQTVAPLDATAVEASLAIDATETVHDLSGRYGVLQATITDDAGKPVSGAPVVFEEIEPGTDAVIGQVGVRYIGRVRTLCTAVSGADGVASCSEDPSIWSKASADRAGRLGPRPTDTTILAYVDDGVFATYDTATSPLQSTI